jgi:quercetin dioxygenase-like cupin family protein
MTGNLRYLQIGGVLLGGLVFFGCAELESEDQVQATMPSGFIPNPLGFGVVPGEVKVKTQVDGVEQALEAKAGDALNYHFIEITLVPGGQTGWHSHAGPEFVTVVEGTITVYEEHDPCHGHDVSAGEALMGNAGHVDIARNHTAQNARLVAMIITPDGVPPRLDEPAPPGADACP